jgi:hypothetical protein
MKKKKEKNFKLDCIMRLKEVYASSTEFLLLIVSVKNHFFFFIKVSRCSATVPHVWGFIVNKYAVSNSMRLSPSRF